MKIGNLTLPKTAALAPMAGVADRAFREICKEFGACYLVGEMASSKGIVYKSDKSAQLLETGPEEHPVAVQLFGDEPETMAQAARFALQYHPDVIDLNMGCPAPKIAGNGGGSALMKNPLLASRIIEAVSQAVELPVTVKFRKGWDEDHCNAVEFARMAQESGAAAITIHGRTRQQMYAPPVDLDCIAQVKAAVSIPVIGNGDVTDLESSIRMYEYTGCDLIMVGRGALGAPWLFTQLRDYFLTGKITPEPSLEEKMAVMVRHISLACAYKGEYIALREARKHVAWYMKGFRGAAEFRRMAGQMSSLEDLKAIAAQVLAQNQEN